MRDHNKRGLEASNHKQLLRTQMLGHFFHCLSSESLGSDGTMLPSCQSAGNHRRDKTNGYTKHSIDTVFCATNSLALNNDSTSHTQMCPVGHKCTCLVTTSLTASPCAQKNTSLLCSNATEQDFHVVASGACSLIVPHGRAH